MIVRSNSNAMSLNVYISADDDSAVATEHLMRYLYAKGYGVASSNQYGTDLDASRQIILAADVLIILLVPHISTSRRAHAEVKLAQSANTPIIPALIQGDVVPALFAEFVVDLRQQQYPELLFHLRRLHPIAPGFVVPPVPAGVIFLVVIVMFLGVFIGLGLASSRIAF